MPKTKSVLKEVKKSLKIKIPKDFDPKESIKDRKGLYVWSSFKDRILANAPIVAKATDISVSSFDLTEYAADEQIEKSLPKKHIFSESDACAVIADLIEKQPKGEEGILGNTGYANLFYTSAFVVYVRWAGGGWGVGAWRRDGYEWFAGSRVFSPAN